MTRDLLLLAVSLFTWGVGEGMFYYFQSINLQRFGADPVTIGTILGANGIAMCVAHIPAGILADRIGRRPMMWLSWYLGIIAAIIMALATSLPLFVIGVLIYGLTTFGLTPINSYVTGARGDLSVGRALTISSASFSFGAVLGPTFGGWIGDFISLQAVYGIAAVIFIISTIIIMLVKPQPLQPPSERERGTHLLHNQRFIAYLGVVFISIMALYLHQPLSANFLQNERGLSLVAIGNLGSINSLGSTLIMLAAGHFAPGLVFIIGQVLVAFSALFIWQGNSMGWYGLAYFFLGGYKLCHSMIIAQTRPLIRPTEMGLAYGIVETVIASTYILTPVLAGFLYDWDPATMYPFGIGMIFLALIASVAFMIRSHSPAGETHPAAGPD